MSESDNNTKAAQAVWLNKDKATANDTANTEKASQLGWLDDNGICHFPEDVQALVAGYRAIGIPAHRLAAMTPTELMACVNGGVIRFVDGNGDVYTFAEYVKRYPDYPDPVWQLTIRGKWPPTGRGVLHVGRKVY